MTIIITKNGKNAKMLEKDNFKNEAEVQKYIHDNPSSLPLYELKDDLKLLILKREFPTNSGPADAIGIDKDGDLYIIETKLYKNYDKRNVLAQVLDYGSSIWKNTDFSSFLDIIEREFREKYNLNFEEKISDFFDLSDDEFLTLNDNLESNLNKGIFKFVILMNKIDNRLKDLIIFMNQNTNFDIYGIEFDIYRNGNEEIIIPRLFGNEVKKDSSIKRRKNIFYSIEYHLNKTANENIKKIFFKLRDEILKYKNVTEEYKAVYITYKIKNLKNFIDFKFQKDNIKITLNMPKGKLKDNKGITRDVSNIGHNGNGDYEISLNKNYDVKDILNLIKQSYDYNNI